MLKKLKQLLILNRAKLTWFAISLGISGWMVHEQAQGSPWQFIALILLAVTMWPAATIYWRSLPPAPRNDSEDEL